MIGRMDLRGAPDNLGAHLLAWEIGLEPERLIPFETLHPGMIERLLAGEVLPGADLGAELSALSRGRIPVGAWRHPAAGRWVDPPAPWAGAWCERVRMHRQQHRQLKRAA